APQQGDRGKDERNRVPARLQLFPRAFAVAERRELPDAQVRGEADRELTEVIAVGEDALQSRLQAPQFLGRLRGQPGPAPPRAVPEEAELTERDGERLDAAADGGEGRHDRRELSLRPEGIEQVDVRHPAMDLPVVAAADLLDRLPHLLGRYDGHG